jgi:putative redox protein
MMVNVVVTHAGKMQFTGGSESGYTVVMDAPPAFGGDSDGIKPMELLLMSLGGCSGMDVIDILRKKKQEVTDYKINISGERRDDYPKIFTKIKIEHVVRGRNIDVAAVKRAVELSTDKYCSVIGMVKETAELDVSYKVEED